MINHFISLPKSAELSALQLDLLKETVNRAVSNVPFYRQFYKIEGYNDIYDYPVIAREILSLILTNFCRRNSMATD
jgi:phenylacetate-coenzyme A ligase PaaK-like adenylate-forming protein